MQLALRSKAAGVCWLVPRQLAAQPSPEERVLLEELAGVLDEERRIALHEGAGAYPSLGYDADRLYYVDFYRASHCWRLPPAERTLFCKRHFLAALRHDPGTFVRYVWTQMKLLWPQPYAPATVHQSAYLTDLAKAEEFTWRPPYLSPVIMARYRAELASARQKLEGPWPTPPRVALAQRVAPLLEALNAAFFLCIAVPVLLVVALALYAPWRRKVAWRLALPALCLAVWALGSVLGSALPSSVAQALEVQRYVDLFMPVSLLAQFLWPLVAWSLLRSHCATPERLEPA